jgi:hypothetical protein
MDALQHQPKEVARRLVKLWLPVETVRRMDAAILRSGVYVDRADYVQEAILDRLSEEEHGSGEAGVRSPDETPLSLVPEEIVPFAADVAETVGLFGDWVARSAPTLPPLSGPQTNFGLHNRDYPTVWACDLLGRMTSEVGEPIDWAVFSEELLRQSWRVGRRLAVDDAESGRPVKASTGFPTNMAKKDAAERRFLAHAFGLPHARGYPGPVFVFKWVGVEPGADARISLSEPGLRFLARLAETGDPGPPYDEASWTIFADHLLAYAQPELRAWLSVLELLRERPTRLELVARCTWWKGSEAATNAMSYVSRGREWGLIEARLDDSRYTLTARGTREIDRLKLVLEEGGARNEAP